MENRKLRMLGISVAVLAMLIGVSRFDPLATTLLSTWYACEAVMLIEEGNRNERLLHILRSPNVSLPPEPPPAQDSPVTQWFVN